MTRCPRSPRSTVSHIASTQSSRKIGNGECQTVFVYILDPEQRWTLFRLYLSRLADLRQIKKFPNLKNTRLKVQIFELGAPVVVHHLKYCPKWMVHPHIVYTADPGFLLYTQFHVVAQFLFAFQKMQTCSIVRPLRGKSDLGDSTLSTNSKAQVSMLVSEPAFKAWTMNVSLGAIYRKPHGTNKWCIPECSLLLLSEAVSPEGLFLGMTAMDDFFR